MSYRDTCTSMLVAVLFTVAKMWHHRRCPAAENWVAACGVYTQWNFSIHKEPGYGVCRKIVQLEIIILSVSEGQLSYAIFWFLELYTKSYILH